MKMSVLSSRSASAVRPGIRCGRLLFSALLLALVWTAACAAAQLPPPAAQAGANPGMVPSHLSVPQLSLTPFLQVYIDTTGEMDVEEVAALPPETSFSPLDVRNLPRVAGVTWLRFVLDAATAGHENSAILLDMGESVPGVPALFSPLFNAYSGSVEWQETSSAPRNVLLLPKAGAEAQVCFLRLDGLPGLWFSPTLRTPHNAATDLSGLASKSALLALGVVMLLCLLRGLSEHGQWRIWTALYVAAALVQGYCGIPGSGSGHFSLEDAAALLTPGLALMFLPHVGRHLMRTRGRHRFLDAQFILLVLPGAALALLPPLLPLVPDMAWMVRFLPLWPVCTLLLAPTATAACLMGLPGARRFLLGILLPPVAVAAAVMGLNSGYAPSILASLPLWGTALSALVIAATSVPRQDEEDEEEAPIDLTMPAIGQGGLPAADAPLGMGQDSRSEMLPVFDDPNLRLLPGEETGIVLPNMDDTFPPREENVPAPTRPDEPAPTPVPARTESGSGLPDAERLEEALRRPLDDLMRESAALEQFSLPPSVRQTAQNMTAAARRMLNVLRDPADALPDVVAPSLQETFDLQDLMRSVHDSVAAAAENGGIALAWYMPPHLPSFYSGEFRALDAVLRELLESAVRATRQGAVHLSVRRVPDSDDPGHLLFTVQDSGSGTPPAERSSLALSHAWELAGRHNGFLSAECGIRGATIAFTLHLEPVEGVEDGVAPSPAPAERKIRRARILVCTPGAMDRQALVHMLDGLSCVVLQARTLAEALALHEQRPVTMLLAAGSQVSPDAQDTLERFRQRATEARLPVFGAIAVTGDDSRWDALARAGFTHALLEPVDRQALRQTVQEILDAFFGSQGGTDDAKAEAAPSRPAGFPPLSGILGREESSPASTVPTVEPEGGHPVDNTPQGAEPPESGTPAAASPSEPSRAETEPEARENDAEVNDKPCIDNQWGAARPTADELPAIDNQWGVSRPAGDTRAVIDNQWGMPPAVAADTLQELDNQWGRDAGVSAADSGESARDDDRRISLNNAWGDPAPAPATSLVENETAEALTGADAPASAPEPSAREEALPESPRHEEPPVAGTGAVTPGVPETPGTSTAAMEAPAVVRPVADMPSASPASGERFIEWVGEPTPIPKTAVGAPEGSRPRPDSVETRRETRSAPDAPVTLTLREALEASAREEGGRQQAAPGRSPAPAASASRDAEGSGTPSLLRRVLERLQGESGRGQGTMSGKRPEVPSAGQPSVAMPKPEPAASAPSPAAARPSAPEAAPKSVSSAAAPTVAPKPAAPAGTPARSAPVDGTVRRPEASTTGIPRPLPPESVREAASLDQEMLDLVARFDSAVRVAQQAFANGNCEAVARAAEAIAEDADSFGFRRLGRMARCVQQAGRHEDLGALRDLLPDLVTQVERNRIAIQKELH